MLPSQDHDFICSRVYMCRLEDIWPFFMLQMNRTSTFCSGCAPWRSPFLFSSAEKSGAVVDILQCHCVSALFFHYDTQRGPGRAGLCVITEGVLASHMCATSQQMCSDFSSLLIPAFAGCVWTPQISKKKIWTWKWPWSFEYKEYAISMMICANIMLFFFGPPFLMNFLCSSVLSLS